MRIAVIGLGKIGLPLAVQYASKGHSVVGADTNGATVGLVNAGIEPFPGEDQLAERLIEVHDTGNLRAITDTAAAVGAAGVVVVAVPLYVDGKGTPDFTALDDAAASIGRGLTRGTLVCFETTLPVGTTRDRLTPVLEAASKLTAGRDFFVVFSPERVFTGRVFADLRRYPKLVGGIDDESAARATTFYETVLDFDDRPDLARPNGVWDLGSAEAAELAKLAETTYRDVNIGLANQFARFATTIGVDIDSVIAACNSQPFSHIHQPGIAVGGHCIPVYPQLYLWNDPSASIVRVAREANLGMPNYAVNVLEHSIGGLEGTKVLVLGAAYRGGVKETAFSGVFTLKSELLSRGATPLVHDPMYNDDELKALGLSPWNRTDQVDAVILQADHVEYQEWTDQDVPGVRAVVDGRRRLSRSNWSNTIFSRL